MAHEVVMPQMGLSMDSGTIIGWLKRSGDQIQVGDILFEVESDKATVEVEAVESGELQVVLGPDDGERRPPGPGDPPGGGGRCPPRPAGRRS